MNYHIVLVLMLNVILAIIVNNCQGVEHVIEEEWIEPDAWGRKVTVERKTEYINLPKDTNNKNVNNEDAFLYYKKLINSLFERDKLQYNAMLGRYCRSLVFQVMPTQLSELETITDLRELDLMLEEIILNAYSTNLCMDERNGNFKSTLSFLALIWDIFKDVGQLLKTVELQISVIGGLCVILAWWCYRRYGFRGVLTFVFLSSIVFGYFITYLECNRKLETEEQLELLDDEEEETQLNFFTKMSNWIFAPKTKKQELRKKLLKLHKIPLPFCRPDHVLLMYGNDIFLKQIQFLIEKCVSTIESINNDLSFPLNYFAAGAVIYLIGFMVKLSFKYIINPSAWIAILTSNSNVHFTQQSRRTNQQHTESAEDRISGENLKALLNLMKNTHSNVFQNIPTNTSGAQDVLEPLEAPTTYTPNNTPIRSRTNSPTKTTNENNSMEILKNQSASTATNENNALDTLENSTALNLENKEKSA